VEREEIDAAEDELRKSSEVWMISLRAPKLGPKKWKSGLRR
jgi:hypothetical protein